MLWETRIQQRNRCYRFDIVAYVNTVDSHSSRYSSYFQYNRRRSFNYHYYDRDCGYRNSCNYPIARNFTRLIAHLILSFAVTYTAAYLFGKNNMVYITGVISFYNVFFLASLLAATNLGSRECLPDIIIPLSFVLFFLIPNYASLIQHLQIAYLVIRVAIKFISFVRINRQYWYWINPPRPNEGLSATH